MGKTYLDVKSEYERKPMNVIMDVAADRGRIVKSFARRYAAVSGMDSDAILYLLAGGAILSDKPRVDFDGSYVFNKAFGTDFTAEQLQSRVLSAFNRYTTMDGLCKFAATISLQMNTEERGAYLDLIMCFAAIDFKVTDQELGYYVFVDRRMNVD